MSTPASSPQTEPYTQGQTRAEAFAASQQSAQNLHDTNAQVDAHLQRVDAWTAHLGTLH